MMLWWYDHDHMMIWSNSIITNQTWHESAWWWYDDDDGMMVWWWSCDDMIQLNYYISKLTWIRMMMIWWWWWWYDDDRMMVTCFYWRQLLREAVWDLFQSESAFLRDHLMTIKNVFMEPLKKVCKENTFSKVKYRMALWLLFFFFSFCSLLGNLIWIFRSRWRVLWCLQNQRCSLAISMSSAV